MDSISGEFMIYLFFNNLHIDTPEIVHESDLLLRVVADIYLKSDEKVVYHEVEFPIVELAIALIRWVGEDVRSRRNFEFESMQSSEVGLIRFISIRQGWTVGSVHSVCSVQRTFSLVEIEAAVNAYVKEVRDRMKKDFGVDLEMLSV